MSAARDPVAEPALADLAVFRPVKAGNTFEETVERLAQAVKLGVVPNTFSVPPALPSIRSSIHFSTRILSPKPGHTNLPASSVRNQFTQ